MIAALSNVSKRRSNQIENDLEMCNNVKRRKITHENHENNIRVTRSAAKNMKMGENSYETSQILCKYIRTKSFSYPRSNFIIIYMIFMII